MDEKLAIKMLKQSLELFATHFYKHQVTPINVSNFEEAFNNILRGKVR